MHWHKDGTKCELSGFRNSLCQIRGECANARQSWGCWNIFPDRFFKTYKQRWKDFWTRRNSKSLQLITQQHLASVPLSAKKMTCNSKVVKVADYSGTQFWKRDMKGGRRQISPWTCSYAMERCIFELISRTTLFETTRVVIVETLWTLLNHVRFLKALWSLTFTGYKIKCYHYYFIDTPYHGWHLMINATPTYGRRQTR